MQTVSDTLGFPLSYCKMCSPLSSSPRCLDVPSAARTPPRERSAQGRRERAQRVLGEARGLASVAEGRLHFRRVAVPRARASCQDGTRSRLAAPIDLRFGRGSTVERSSGSLGR